MDKSLFTTEPFLSGRPLKVWLDNIGIKDWKINGDGLVNVVGDVKLDGRLGELERLPVRFGSVSGKFLCNDNQLESLEGAPKVVGEYFDCHDNLLASLEGAPKEVGGWFSCNNNQLVSLEGAPKLVGESFWCGSNQLVSLKGLPEKIGGSLDCDNNQLVSLEGGPKEVNGDFYCSENQLVSLEGAPEKVGGHFWCDANQLVSLEGAPKQVGGNLHCDHNLLVGFKGLEGLSIKGGLFVTDPEIDGRDNVFVSLDGLPKELYSKVVGLDIQVIQESEKKQAASFLDGEVEELISEVELG